MSQFLLCNRASGENDFQLQTDDIPGKQNKAFLLDDFILKLSWFNNNQYKPWHESNTALFFSIGILYLNGTRIDKSWELINLKWNEEGVEALNVLNGYGNLLIYDKRKESFFIITSRMGFLPIYSGKNESSYKMAIGTHPDEISRNLDIYSLDKLSVAEFIATSCISAPYTYYENIKQLEPASVYKFEGKKLFQIETYWQPDLDHDDFASIQESAALIASYIKESTNRRISNNGNKGLLLLSGGLDSRAVLFAPDYPSEMLEAVTFYNEPNIELKLSSQLASKAGVKHHHLKRDYDYYGKLAIDAVKLTGGMWNIGCLHTSGFNDELYKINKGVLLSGMYFDTFFKGFAFDKKILHKRMTGSIYKGYPGQDIYWDTRGANDLKYEWQDAIHRRRAETYGYDSIPEDALTPQILNKIKYSRIGNMARIRSGGMDIALYKSQFYDMVVSDINFSKVFSFLNPYDELKSDFMNIVIKNLTEDNISVADSNVLNSEFLMNNYYLTVSRNILRKRIKKFLPKSKKNDIAVESSWINWYTYRHNSELINSLWKECKQDESISLIIEEMLGYNPFELKPDYSSSKYDFLNLLTVGLWLKYGYTK